MLAGKEACKLLGSIFEGGGWNSVTILARKRKFFKKENTLPGFIFICLFVYLLIIN